MTVTSRQKTPFKVTSQNWGEDQNPETPCGSQKSNVLVLASFPLELPFAGSS